MINENEKKYIYIVFAVVIIVLIIVLGIIWTPLLTSDSSFDEQISSYQLIEAEKFNKEITDKYLNLAKKYIEKNNFNTLKKVLDKNYIDNLGISEEDIEEYLISNNLLINVNSSTIIYNSSCKDDGKTYLYTYSYKDNSNLEKKIHFIESYYGKYTVSFDQESYPTLDNQNHITEQEGVVYEAKNTKCYDDSIIVKLNISNNSSEEMTFDLSSVEKVNIEMNGANHYKLSTIIAGNESSYLYLAPGSKRQIDLSFSVPIEEQKNITEIKFKDVKYSNGDLKDITVEFK